MAVPKYVFFRGRVVPYSDVKVGVLTHALNYGTAVFGGLRAYWNEDEKQLFVFRPQDHFRRFLQSAKLLCMELPHSADDMVNGLLELIRTEGHKEDLYVRPLAFYSDEIIGVKLHDLHAEVSMVVLPFGNYISNEDGMHVTISSWRRIDDNVIPARGKIAGAYVNSAFAKTDALRAGFDEVIVLNNDGHISEGSAANFFMLRNGVFATPPITRQRSRGDHAAHDHATHPRRTEDGSPGAPDRSHGTLPLRRSFPVRHGRADRRDWSRRLPLDRFRQDR